jgi:branched-chain amino acid aminotransferase
MLTFRGSLYVSIEPLKRLPLEVYEKGVHVETVTIQRDSPRVKSTAFIGQSEEERKLIAKKGIFEALLVHRGRILEGMTSNFFYVIDGILCTAQRSILLGVTRRTVIRVARGEGLEVKYKSLKLDQLPDVSEAFITSSSRGIVPVVQIDDFEEGQGSVGEITKHLSLGYGKYMKRKAEKI